MTQYLIDTSVWIDFLNKTPGPARDFVHELAREPDSLATTEPVLMELRAGVAGQRLVRVEATLNRFHCLTVDPALDFHAAADLYRAARTSGQTIRSMVDCLIAATALRTGAVLVHKDRDFDVVHGLAQDLHVRSCRTD